MLRLSKRLTHLDQVDSPILPFSVTCILNPHRLIDCMTLDQILLKEIKDSELWLSRTNEESTYKRDLKKRIELINWVLGNMKNPEVEICSLLESRMNETIQEIKKKDSIFESDILDIELRILDWIFYQVCKDQQKNWEKSLLGYQK